MSQLLTAWRVGPVAPSVPHLLFDDFVGGAVASPRPAQPGPGQWQVINSGGALGIAGDVLSVDGTPAIGDGLISSDLVGQPQTFTHTGGRVALAHITQRTTVSDALRVGWSPTNLTDRGLSAGFSYANGDLGAVGGTATINLIPISGNSHRLYALMRASGGYAWLVAADNALPRLLWITETGSAPAYLKLPLGNSVLDANVAQIVLTDTMVVGDEWQVVSVPTVGLGWYTHPPNMIIRCRPALDGSEHLRIRVRQSEGNFWEVVIGINGVINLDELDVNLPSVRVVRASAAAGTIAPNAELTIVAVDTSIHAYVDGVRLWQYNTALLNQFATTGYISGAGHTINTWRIWDADTPADVAATLQAIG